jgi:hypothetical protein
MFHSKFLKALAKAFRFYAGLALIVLLFQFVGVAMYLFNVWPGMRGNLSAGVTGFVSLAVVLILIRSSLWIQIYRSGGRSFAILHQEGDATYLADRITPTLKTLTRLLVATCILEVCFVPVVFLSDALLPFTVSGLWLGVIYLSILLLPQGFGVGALILAFLTHQYGQLLRERGQMKEEIELTI